MNGNNDRENERNKFSYEEYQKIHCSFRKGNRCLKKRWYRTYNGDELYQFCDGNDCNDYQVYKLIKSTFE